MCYFTDKEYVKKLKGIFPENELPLLGKAVLKRAIKLQIGCGTEPTLYKNVEKIILLGSKHKVPYISMTTNANNIERETLEKWCAAGLNEITVSLHGTTKETYEEMMGRGNFERFILSLSYITEIKKRYPSFQLRINYTFNEDNFDELNLFGTVFKDIDVDVLQIRPIFKMGDTTYNNFSMEKIIPKYNSVYDKLKKDCKNNNTLFMAPEKSQLEATVSSSSIVYNYTYFYISPTFFWNKNFDWKNENFNQYSNRIGYGKELLKMIFSSKKELAKLLNDKLKYNIS
jgi:MoaA/NifB/PqqE/SkfB family radical SAM enzyme